MPRTHQFSNWFAFGPREWLEATRTLTPEQRGIYIDLIAIQMLRETPVPEDYAELGHACRVSKRKVKAVVDYLLEHRKIYRPAPVVISNERCEDEIGRRDQQRRQAKKAAERRWAQADVNAAVDSYKKANEPDSRAENELKTSRKSSENELKISRKNREKEIDVKENNDLAMRSHVSGIPPAYADAHAIYNNSIDSPPTPPGGEQRALALASEVEPKIGKRDVDQAFEVYNSAAEHFGFAKTQRLTAPRRTRLKKRLADIGGVSNFRRALWAIRLDPFLSGKTPAKDGGKPFRMSLDRLLQTGGGLGDVLARLLDAADEQSEKAKPTRGTLQAIASLSDEEQSELVKKHANGIWPLAVLAAPPGYDGCQIRREVYISHGITEDTYTESGIKRRGVI